jgi:hypothetical protein
LWPTRAVYVPVVCIGKGSAFLFWHSSAVSAERSSLASDFAFGFDFQGALRSVCERGDSRCRKIMQSFVTESGLHAGALQMSCRLRHFSVGGCGVLVAFRRVVHCPVEKVAYDSIEFLLLIKLYSRIGEAVRVEITDQMVLG